MSYTFDATTYFETDEEEREKPECMKHTYHTDPRTGRLDRRVWRCKDFRNCNYCMEWRVMQETELLEQLSEHVDQFRLEVCSNPAQAQKLVSSLRRHGVLYRRYPYMEADNEYIAVIAPENEWMPFDLSEYNIDNLAQFAATVMNTSERKRVSGTLKQLLPQEEEEELDMEWFDEAEVAVITVADEHEHHLKDIWDKSRAVVLDEIKRNSFKPDCTQVMIDRLQTEVFRRLYVIDISYEHQYNRRYEFDVRNVQWDSFNLGEYLISLGEPDPIPTMTEKEFEDLNELLFD